MTYDNDRLRHILVLLVATTAAACGDDGDPNGNMNAAGSAGQATGGSAGSAGSKGGSAGSSGSSTGGSAGAGEAGAAGSDDGAGGAGDGGAGGDDGEGGEGGEAEVEITPFERVLMGQLSPLPAVPADPTNAYADDDATAALGQMLFFDASYSGPLARDSDLGLTGQSGKVSCASCHSSSTMADGRSMPPNVSVGTNLHTRNAPGLVNSAYYAWTNWGGRFSTQWELPIAVAESPLIMNSTRLAVAHTIFDKYRSEYETIFGAMEPEIGTNTTRFPVTGKPTQTSWDTMNPDDQVIINRIYVNYAKALQAYMRRLVSKNTPFDQLVAGDDQALTNQEKRGLKLFVGKARCNICHVGANLSDDDFHNLGVPAHQVDGAPVSDDGRFKDVPPLLASAFNGSGMFSDDPGLGLTKLAGLTNPMSEQARGAFRTASLRGISSSAPYMHSGQLPTLEAVVEFYNSGGGTPPSGTKDPLLVPLYLSIPEQADLVGFLKTLNGDPIPSALLEDTSK